jgi:hypothetical protein
LKSKIDELADRVNEVLTPREVLEAIGYRTEGIQEKGDTVRCYCPIHKDTLLRSMTIDIAKRTFKCMYAGCAGRTGGTYLNLYRLATEADLEESLVVLAQVAGIDVAAFGKGSAQVPVREEKAPVEEKSAKAKGKKAEPKTSPEVEEPLGGEMDSDLEIEPIPPEEALIEERPAEAKAEPAASPKIAQPDEISQGTTVERGKPIHTGSKDPERVSKRTSFL